MNKLIKYLVNGYWEYKPNVIANTLNIGIGSVKDEDITEYPLTYTYNKNTDSNKLFFFVGNNMCYCATLGNKPLEKVKKHNSKGKTFRKILFDYPQIKKLYVINNANNHRFSKFYGYVSSRDFYKMGCLYVQYGVGTNTHRNKESRVNFEESTIEYFNRQAKYDLKNRLIKYKDTKINAIDVQKELVRVLRNCADHIEGHKDFKKHTKSRWYNTVVRELFTDLFNHYKDSLTGKDKVELMDILRQYH